MAAKSKLEKALARVAELEDALIVATAACKAEIANTAKLNNNLSKLNSELDDAKRLADGRAQTVRDLNTTIADLERYNGIQAGYIQRVLEDEAVRELGADRNTVPQPNSPTHRRSGPQQNSPPWAKGWGGSARDTANH